MSDIEFRVKALWVKSRIEKVLVYENKERVWIHNIAVNNLDLRKLPSVKIKTDVSSENTVGWLDSFVNLTVLTRWTHHARVISSNFEAQTLSATESLKNSIGPKILIKVWLLENNQIQLSNAVSKSRNSYFWATYSQMWWMIWLRGVIPKFWF